MSDVPEQSDFEDMLERAQHGYFDKHGILQVPDDGPWPVLCLACEGRTHIENVPGEIAVLLPYKRLSYDRSEDTWTVVCAYCDGWGTIIDE